MTPLKLTKPLQNGLTAFIVGVALLVAGSVVCSNWAKYTLEAYAGFSLLLAGVLLLVLGAFKVVEDVFHRILSRELRTPRWLPPRFAEISPKSFFLNLQVASAGIAFALVGSLAASTFAKFTLENYLGFGLLLFGEAALVFGVIGVVAAYLLGAKHISPMFSGFQTIGYGAALLAIGFITGNLFEKYSVENYAGFGMQLLGVFAVSFGVFRVVNASIEEHIEKVKPLKIIRVHQKALFTSLMVVAFSIAATIVGSTVISQFANASIQNYFGYSILLLGVVVLLLGNGGIGVAFVLPHFTAAKARQNRIATLETADLESISDEGTKSLMAELEGKMFALLKDKDQASIADLAYDLNLSDNLTRKLLQKEIQQNLLYGYLTVDGEKYYSAVGLRSSLAELLKKN
jgi:hypothetical protein